jgi:hypothetical protein
VDPVKRIPSQLLTQPLSDAEVRIFALLGDVNMRGTALHSLNVSDHRWKPWTEIDFLLVLPFGLMALEVKGGLIRRHEGIWFTGRAQLKESPYDQARSAIFAVRDLLGNRASGLTGWGIVTPDSGPIPDTPESPSWMQASERDCFSAAKFGEWLVQLQSNWRKRYSIKPELTDSEMGQLIGALRPNFDAHVPLSRAAIHVSRDIKRFTDEQLTRLDEFEENERVICRGGAGTGKTFLAIEAARREVGRGNRVLMVARSKLFTSRLAEHVAELTGVVVWAYEPEAGPPLPGPFDALIVDEGQDLLVWDFVSICDRLLRGGMEAGRWYWFMDDAHQAGFYPDTDPDLAQFLKQQCRAAVQRLRTNCRNTENVVAFTKIMTGADIGEALVRGHGPAIETVFVDSHSELSAARKRIELLQNDTSIAPAEIAVLCIDSRLVASISSALGPSIQVHSVREFKGCEATYVLIVGIGSHALTIEDLRSSLYTAVTRSRVWVWIAVPNRLRESWESVIDEYVEGRLTQGP